MIRARQRGGRLVVVAALAATGACTSGAARPPEAPTISPTATAVSTTIAATTTIAVTIAPNGSALALDLLGGVKVETEHRGGYVRDLFGYPADFGNGCDTRAEVLRRDSTTPPVVKTSGCTVLSGTWRSPYDGATVTSASALQIDHVVALKEAWDSGAWAWSPAKRHAFANDVEDPRTLRAATIATNQDKGDKDPSNWLPPDPGDVCPFLADWVEIKVRWGLTMDPSEFGRIRNLLRGQCAGTTVAPFIPVPAALG